MSTTGTIVGSGRYTYEVNEDWAKLPDGWAMPAAAVTVDSQDRVYCFNRTPDHPVVVFDRDGNYLHSWGAGLFAFPHTIRVDGHDLSRMRLRDYRSHLGAVLQESFLFDGTIADNIAYAKPGASRAEIEEVARIAHCDEFVREFEQVIELWLLHIVRAEQSLCLCIVLDQVNQLLAAPGAAQVEQGFCIDREECCSGPKFR